MVVDVFISGMLMMNVGFVLGKPILSSTEHLNWNDLYGLVALAPSQYLPKFTGTNGS